MDGMHLAVLFGAVLAALSAVLVWRFLPAQTPMVAGHGAIDEVDSVELTAELGIAGALPVLDDVPMAADSISMN